MPVSPMLRPNIAKSALITIDMQKDFVLPGSIAEVNGTFAVIPNIAKLQAYYRDLQLPIIHVVRLYLEDGSNVDLCRRELIQQGRRIVNPASDGAGLVEELRVADAPLMEPETLLGGQFQEMGRREWLMYKPRWGAFYHTPLEAFLRENEIDTVVFCGCNFPNCPRTSIYEASERDFRTVLITDAVSGTYERGLEELANIGVNLYTTESLLAGV